MHPAGSVVRPGAQRAVLLDGPLETNAARVVFVTGPPVRMKQHAVESNNVAHRVFDDGKFVCDGAEAPMDSARTKVLTRFSLPGGRISLFGRIFLR